MKLHSLHIGKLQRVEEGKNIKVVFETGMLKDSIDGEVFCTQMGFVGDFVSDTKNHGGLEKAVFANSLQNYAIWSKYLKKDMKIGFMGENLCIDGLDENKVCVGDIHKIGSLILQVSQPRKPCFKISGVWDDKGFTKEIFKTGLTGWYYRVLEAGSAKRGDEIEIVKKDEVCMSVMEVNMLFYDPKNHLNLMDKFKRLKTLSSGWESVIAKRIKGVYDNSYMSEL